MQKVSVIIPVYNCEKYLKRCIDSVLNQTFNDYEVILINDGSIDKSAIICDEYATRDKRIKVLHKKNQGVSSARNDGIKRSEGEWICFLDADDWWECDFLENLLKCVSKFGVDMCMVPFILEYKDKSYNTLVFENYVGDIAEVIVGNYTSRESLLCTLWNKLYNRKIIIDNNILFPEGLSYAEDSIFNLTYLKYIKTIHISDKPYYHYWQESENSGVKRLHENSDIAIIKFENALKSCFETFNLTDDISIKFVNRLIGSRWIYVTEICVKAPVKETDKIDILSRWYSGLSKEVLIAICNLHSDYSFLAEYVLKYGTDDKIIKKALSRIKRTSKTRELKAKIRRGLKRIIIWK